VKRNCYNSRRARHDIELSLRPVWWRLAGSTKQIITHLLCESEGPLEAIRWTCFTLAEGDLVWLGIPTIWLCSADGIWQPGEGREWADAWPPSRGSA
jgi:hypothetical protein